MRKRLRGLTAALAVPFRADPGRAWAVLVCFALKGVADVSLAYWLKVIVDAAAEADTTAAVGGAVALATTAGLGLLAGAAGVRQQFPLSERAGHHVDRQVVEASAGVAGLEMHERPEYVNQLELLRTQQRVLANAGPTAAAALGILIEVVGTMVLLASVNPVLLVVPLFALPSLWAGHRAEELHQQTLDQSGEGIRRARHLFELSTSSGAAKELRVFHLGDELVRRHRETWDGVDAAHDRAAWQGMIRTAAGWAVFVLGYVGAVVVTVREAVAGRASVGDVVLVLTLLAQITNQVMGATETVSTLARMSKVAGRYLWLLDAARSARAGPANPAPAPDRLTGGIRCRSVGFRYPGNETEVLADIDLDIRAGTTVALVGENGAGKSTLVKLLCRFYEPTSGTIEADGVELADIEVERWREGITAGFQDFARLELVVRQSVGVGDVAWADDDIAVRAALGRAAASDVVDGFPAGLDTQLGRSFRAGVEPSGGQWQKLALGRAMMRERPVLVVLDEPTAALDTDAEAALFRRYAGISRALAAENGAITLLVSHRFSTVRLADLIVVIDGGRVVELGSHDELMAAHGLYQELFDLQARPYR